MKTRKSNPKSTKYGVCYCICLTITLLLFGTLGRNVATASEKSEKTNPEHWIAIASNGKTLNSPVSHKLKLAKYFVLYDMESNSYKIIKNNYEKNTFREVLIANMLIAKRVSCVICGNCTNRATDILKRGDVFICLHAEESVQKVIDDYRDALGKSRKSSINPHSSYQKQIFVYVDALNY